MDRSGAVPVIARDSAGRLPASVGDQKILGFATLSHSNLKSWAKITAAQGHNTRSIETPNARKDAPVPIELLEEKSGLYVERVKAILRTYGWAGTPIKPRKNGTIATEDVYGASPEYWNREGSWRLKSVEEIKNDPVVKAAIDVARRKHGNRLVSCSLHLDEESPHVHVIAVPLVEREHSKRGRKPTGTPRDETGKPLEDSRDKVMKWSLDVSTLRGRSSDLEKNHDEWAEACKPFGLVRGQKGSDMPTEQRRARRNRQTGRSSKAEMVARQERERLHEKANRSRKRGANYVKQAKIKAKAAEAERLAAKMEREEAKAATVRALAQEAQNERIQAKLDARETELESREQKVGEQAASLQLQAAVHNDQMRLFSKALDPTSSFELHVRNGEIEVEGGMDDGDRNASRGSWDWLTVGLLEVAQRLTDLRNREAAAAERIRKADEELALAKRSREDLANERSALRAEEGEHQLRLGVLKKIIDPEGTDRIVERDGELIMLDINEADKTLVTTGPRWFSEALNKLVKKLFKLAKDQEKVRAARKAVSLREDAVAQLEAEKARLSFQRGEFQKEQSAWRIIFDRAKAFQTAWQSITPEERAPAINDALGKADGLTADDLPPGYTVPGTGGQER